MRLGDLNLLTTESFKNKMNSSIALRLIRGKRSSTKKELSILELHSKTLK